MRTKEKTWKRVQVHYAKAPQAPRGGSTCCDANYSEAELSEVPADSVMGLGSGNPVRHANLHPGEVVLDLGSGAGVDVYLAATRVGPDGKAIGIDMTPEMVQKAREIAEREGVMNVEFHEARIEDLPTEDSSVDVVVSNCVINLSPDKAAVFEETFRVLRPGGRLIISDIVQEHPLKGIEDDCGCVATAMVRADYLDTIRAAGFHNLEILEDKPWLWGPRGLDASAITLRAEKPR